MMLAITSSSGVSTALHELMQFPGQLSSISARAQGVSVGRWTIHTNARHGSFLLGNQADVSYSFDLDYPLTRTYVYDVRDRIEDEFIEAWTGIAQVIEWIRTDVGRLAALLSASNLGEDVTADLASAAEAAASAFAAAEAALLNLVNKQEPHTAAVAELPSRSAAETRERRTELAAVLAVQPAGHKDALAQFEHFQTELGISVQELTSAVAEMRLATQQALANVRIVAAAIAQLRVDERQVDGVAALLPTASPEAVRRALGTDQRATQWVEIASAITPTIEADPLKSPLRTEGIRERANRRRD